MLDIARSTRNVTIFGRRTSLRLEDAFWAVLDEAVAREGRNFAELCEDLQRTVVDGAEGRVLSSALRVFAIEYMAGRVRRAVIENVHLRQQSARDVEPAGDGGRLGSGLDQRRRVVDGVETAARSAIWD